MKKIKDNNGFTLVELLLVVTILGILAALALPRFFPQAEKSRVSEAIGMLSAIRQGEEAYVLENGQALPIGRGVTAADDALWEQIGIDNPNRLPNRYFTYDVQVPTVGGTAFRGRALRNALNDPGGNNNRIIGLARNGTYCGNHPNTPSNAGVAADACP